MTVMTVSYCHAYQLSIAKAATRTKGAAGPSGLDADGWRRILISKNYGKDGKDLRIALARMTYTLCTVEIVEENSEFRGIRSQQTNSVGKIAIRSPTH